MGHYMKKLLAVKLVIFLQMASGFPGSMSAEEPATGTYNAIYTIGGATYRTTFSLQDSGYTKEFYFLDEDELISRCAGEYRISKTTLYRTDRTCQFLRAEEPDAPENHADAETKIKSVTDSSFTLFLNKEDTAVPDTALWLTFVKKKD